VREDIKELDTLIKKTKVDMVTLRVIGHWCLSKESGLSTNWHRKWQEILYHPCKKDSMD
jgi:hypothetical protein